MSLLVLCPQMSGGRHCCRGNITKVKLGIYNGQQHNCHNIRKHHNSQFHHFKTDTVLVIFTKGNSLTTLQMSQIVANIKSSGNCYNTGHNFLHTLIWFFTLSLFLKLQLSFKKSSIFSLISLCCFFDCTVSTVVCYSLCLCWSCDPSQYLHSCLPQSLVAMFIFF